MGKLGTILGILAVIFAFIPLLMALITGWGYHLPGNTFALQRFLGVNLALPCLTIGLSPFSRLPVSSASATHTMGHGNRLALPRVCSPWCSCTAGGPSSPYKPHFPAP